MAGWVTAEIAHSKAASYYEKYLRSSLDIIMGHIVKDSEEGCFSTEVECSEFIKGKRTTIHEQWYGVYKEVDDFYNENKLNERGKALLSIITDILLERGFYVEEFVRYPSTECILIKWDGAK